MVKKNMDETNKGFMKHLGGLDLKKIDDTKYEFSVKVKEMHLNTGKIAHGGFLSTIADTGMGTAAHRVAGDRRCVTINLDMKFISASMLDDKLKGTVKILKKIYLPHSLGFFYTAITQFLGFENYIYHVSNSS